MCEMLLLIISIWFDFNSVFNTPDEKTGEGEQKEETDSQLSDLASQAEECPRSIPTEDKETIQSQDILEEELSAKTQKPVSQPKPTRTNTGRGRPPKTSHLLTQKKTSVKNKEESGALDAPALQDDTADADYILSKYIFIESLFSYLIMMYASMFKVWKDPHDASSFLFDGIWYLDILFYPLLMFLRNDRLYK